MKIWMVVVMKMFVFSNASDLVTVAIVGRFSLAKWIGIQIVNMFDTVCQRCKIELRL